MSARPDPAHNRPFAEAPGRIRWGAFLLIPRTEVEDSVLGEWFVEIRESLDSGHEGGLIAREESDLKLPEPSRVNFLDGSWMFIWGLDDYVAISSHGFRDPATHPSESLAVAFECRHWPPWDWLICADEGGWPVEH